VTNLTWGFLLSPQRADRGHDRPSLKIVEMAIPSRGGAEPGLGDEGMGSTSHPHVLSEGERDRGVHWWPAGIGHFQVGWNHGPEPTEMG